MARTKDPKAKITYIRLTGELDDFVMALIAKIKANGTEEKDTHVKKSEVVRRIVKAAKDANLLIV